LKFVTGKDRWRKGLGGLDGVARRFDSSRLAPSAVGNSVARVLVFVRIAGVLSEWIRVSSIKDSHEVWLFVEYWLNPFFLFKLVTGEDRWWKRFGILN